MPSELRRNRLQIIPIPITACNVRINTPKASTFIRTYKTAFRGQEATPTRTRGLIREPGGVIREEFAPRVPQEAEHQLPTNRRAVL